MTEFPRRQIGHTGLQVTELGLCCATWGGSQIAVAHAATEEIVGAAWAAGVRYVVVDRVEGQRVSRAIGEGAGRVAAQQPTDLGREVESTHSPRGRSRSASRAQRSALPNT